MSGWEQIRDRIGSIWSIPALALVGGLTIYFVFQDSFSYRRPRHDRPDDGVERGGQQIHQKAATPATRTTPGGKKPATPVSPDGATQPATTPKGTRPAETTPAVTVEAGNGKIVVALEWEDDHSPVTGARVEGWLKGYGGRRATASDAGEARYILSPCPAGTWQIVAFAPGGIELEGTLDVSAAQGTVETRLAVPRPGVGTVAVAFSAPPPLSLQAVLAPEDSALQRWTSRPGASDRIEVSGLPGGRYRLALVAPGDPHPTYVYQHDAPILVGGGLTTVEVPGTWTGHVDARMAGAEGVAPFAGWARLLERAPTGIHSWWVQAEGGHVRFRGLLPGAAVLSLSLGPDVEPLLTTPVDVPAQGEATPELALAATGGLTLHVAEAGTAAKVESVEFGLSRTDGTRIWTGFSEHGASLHVTGLPPDAYQIDAVAPGFRKATEGVRVSAGAIEEVRLGLARE